MPNSRGRGERKGEKWISKDRWMDGPKENSFPGALGCTVGAERELVERRRW